MITGREFVEIGEQALAEGAGLAANIVMGEQDEGIEVSPQYGLLAAARAARRAPHEHTQPIRDGGDQREAERSRLTLGGMRDLEDPGDVPPALGWPRAGLLERPAHGLDVLPQLGRIARVQLGQDRVGVGPNERGRSGHQWTNGRT